MSDESERKLQAELNVVQYAGVNVEQSQVTSTLRMAEQIGGGEMRMVVERCLEHYLGKPIATDGSFASGSRASVDGLCDRLIELVHVESDISRVEEIEYHSQCVDGLEYNRGTLSSRSFEKLSICAGGAETVDSFIECVNADWDGDPLAKQQAAQPQAAPLQATKTNSEHQKLSEEEKIEAAKKLYIEAEGFAYNGQWADATLRYEEAYSLVPGKIGFAYKVGSAAWNAGDCEKANAYLQHFVTYASPQDQQDKLATAKGILTEISTSGCSN